MEIIILSGGLGNQMFQYAFFLRKVSTAGQSKVFIDDYSVIKEKTHNGLEIDSLFSLKYTSPPLAVRILVKFIRKIHILKKNKHFLFPEWVLFLLELFRINVIEEKEDGVYSETYLEKRKGISVYFGYWQTEKYFLHVKEIVRQQYFFQTNKLSKKSKGLYEKISRNEGVSIHIRRGDYLSPEYYATHGCICNNKYYERAISIILEKRKKPWFIVFSDDIEWVKKNLNIPERVSYVDWNKGKESWQDMFLMSQCKDNIIANSSFSWWAAWLNPNPKKIVVSPSGFLSNKTTLDIVPDTWIKL